MTAPFRLLIPGDIHEAMLAHALAARPLECCGFLAGTLADGVARVSRLIPLENEAASPTRYQASAKSLFAAVRACREEGIDPLAIYHSHPTSEPIPSKTDLAEFAWEGLLSLIVSLATDPPTVRGWWLLADTFSEAGWSLDRLE